MYMHTLHCILAQSILRTCTLYTVYLHTIHYVHAHCTLCTFTLYTTYMHTVHCVLQSAQCAHCTLITVHCTQSKEELPSYPGPHRKHLLAASRDQKTDKLFAFQTISISGKCKTVKQINYFCICFQPIINVS